jgi:sugar phosphate isomerase/epimerase
MLKGLALHTGTLDTTPLAEALRVAKATGWDAVELRRADFQRAAEAGQSEAEVYDLVRASGLAVACVGSGNGWMFSQGEERRQQLAIVEEACRRAAELGCTTVMSSVDQGTGDLQQAAEGLREVGRIAAAHGVRFALEIQSLAQQFATVASGRELLHLADHPGCGLLLDTYHLQRTGDGLAGFEAVPLAELAYVQYSDLPAGEREPGNTRDRLCPGQGVVPFREIFKALADKGYSGYLSYEALNPAIQAQPAEQAAREGEVASRSFLPG